MTDYDQCRWVQLCVREDRAKKELEEAIEKYAKAVRAKDTFLQRDME